LVDSSGTAANIGKLDDSPGMTKHARMRLLAVADFVPGTPPVALAADDIHLWLCCDQENVGADTTVRGLLGAYLGVDADTITIKRDSHGKPHLAGPVGADLQFNLSHSGDHLIVAIGRHQALGVDIESGSRPRPWLALAQRYFTAHEYAGLASLPQRQLAQAFLELWSCKEALMKALGRGIAFGLHRLGFGWTSEGTLAGLTEIDAEAGAVEEWHVVRLAPAPNLIGALAWRGCNKNLHAFLAVDSGVAQ
jgi:4'-phosphopantetheinyl transferase